MHGEPDPGARPRCNVKRLNQEGQSTHCVIGLVHRRFVLLFVDFTAANEIGMTRRSKIGKANPDQGEIAAGYVNPGIMNTGKVSSVTPIP